MTTIHAYAANQEKGELESFEYNPGQLTSEQVEIDVSYCGICHSDLSMLDNEWGMTRYPFVPGHEIIGKITALGENVHHLSINQSVGLGWYSESCMTCLSCMSGDHNLCSSAEATIIGRHGGFANKVRAHKGWVIPLPEGINMATSGPLFCGGVTVYNPIIQHNIMPTHRVGVVGIGGLGHMALQFLKAWGTDVTAFSSSPDKEDEARSLGAHHFVNSKDKRAMEKLTNSFDMILVTVNVDLDWESYIKMLAPKGKLHFVGAVSSITSGVFPLIVGQKSISASPLGSPATTITMLEFAGRHKIEPVTETFPMSKVNDALEKLRNGKPRYRLVLRNDF